MALPFRNNFSKEEGQAFPGDTYLADLRIAARTGEFWPKLVIALAFVADLYFLGDTISFAFDTDATNFNSFPDALNSITVVIATIAVVSLYIYIGYVFGKSLKGYTVFRDKLSLASAIIALLVLFLTLVSLTYFRLAAELEIDMLSSGETLSATAVDDSDGTTSAKADSVDSSAVVVNTDGTLSFNDDDTRSNGDEDEIVDRVYIMTLIMLLSAFVSALYAYKSSDAVNEAVYRKSAAALPADRALYNRVFFERSNNPDREREYEKRERELDERAVESAFKLGSLASQLNGIVDPADAYEFTQAQRAITAEYFGEKGNS